MHVGCHVRLEEFPGPWIPFRLMPIHYGNYTCRPSSDRGDQDVTPVKAAVGESDGLIVRKTREFGDVASERLRAELK